MTLRRSSRRWFHGLLALILGLSLAGQAFAAPDPGGGKAVPKPQAPSAIKAISDIRQAKVDESLDAALQKGGQQTFLVKLKGEADVHGASATARAQAAQAGKTPPAQRLAQATAVIDSLKQVADRSQRDLVPMLKGLQARGDVSAYQQFWAVNALAVTGNAKALEALAKRPEILEITPSKTYQLMGGPTGNAAVTGAAPTGGGTISSIEWNIQQINAPQAWALGIDGTGIVVANLDTGVEGSHPALARKWRGTDGTAPIYSWFDAVNNQNSFPYDDHDHGTHTMGTIVGSDESGTNIIGAAPGARWISAKILNAAGSGTDVDIIEAAQWILAPGGDPSKAPDVVSNSWGGGAGIDEWLRPLVQAWRAAGIVPVFANGNTQPGQTSCLVSVPANYPESIGVGATDINNNVAGFSCRGPSPYGEVKPEISAPGVGVRSSVPGGGYQGGWSGTSMATPHVAAVAALLRQANAALTVDDIEQIMTETAVPLTDATYPDVPNNGYGWGLVNAFDAVSAVLTGRGTLTGRVVTAGDDLESPAITHTPATEGYAGFSIPVTAQVSDNVAITEVSLYAKMAGDPYYTVIPMNRTSGNHQSGTYAAEIPGYLVQVPTTTYYIRAVDYGNNPASTAPVDVSVSLGLEPGYSTDLEAQPAGWQHGGTGDTWEWGTPTSGPGAAHSGQNLFATNLAGNYANGANAYLAMPPINLTTSSSAMLQWWEWYDLENNFDFADVWVLDAFGGQTRLMHRTNGSGGWRLTTLDLTPWAGQQILVLFNQTSDGSVVRAGWYIDDVALIGPDAVAPATPTNLSGNADSLGAVTLTWSANSELDLGGYRVYRSATSGSGYSLIGSPSAASHVDNSAPMGVTSYYVVAAVDMWGNESGYSNEVAVTPEGPTVIYFDDMEAGDNGWTHGGTLDQWQRGTPASGPSAPFSGANLWATNLAGNYNNSANAWLMSPAIDLSGVSSATLQFAHWYDFENGWDFGYVEVSSNGGASWTQLGNRFTGSGMAWTQPTFNLDAYAGQSINIRFRNTSDSSVNRVGWYIDDVKVLGLSTMTADGAFISTKEAVKAEDIAPLWKKGDSGYGNYRQEIPGTSVIGSGIGIASLPADATVTILETGRSVRTNPATGGYTLSHAAGAYTARAEAYGYFPQDVAINIPADGTLTQNFFLQPMPTGTVSGVVTNARTGAPIAGAVVRQLEDSRVGSVTTDANGHYSMTLLQGSYTLMVTKETFTPASVTVYVPGNASVTQDAALEPFIGFDGEIGYDDGTAENAWAFFDAGNGWAVRMTPDPSKGMAMLQSASMYFWGTDWPVPGGTAIKVAVFDSTGADGAPGQMVGGPIDATIVRGAWNTIDLSGLGLSFSSDFYVAYIQAAPNPNAPGLATDETGPFSGRSWSMVGGQWAATPEDEGNRMIRATVKYALGAPTITSPAAGSFTNQTDVVVEGTTLDGVLVTIYNDGVAAGSATSAGGTFAIPVTLHDGANVLTATATVAAGETRPGAPVTVTVDQMAPALTVSNPADNSATNREGLNVMGAASDTHLASVTVNGAAVTMTGDTFTQRILLNPGANTIIVVATDLAGNATTIERHITLDMDGPQLSNIQPAANVTLGEGQNMTVSFDAEPGLPQAGFRIVLAGSAPGNGASGETPNMTETSPGHYEGTFTAPAGTTFTGASVYVWATDSAGNTAEVEAAGKLTVGPSAPQNQAPTAKITLPKSPKAKQNLTFSGAGSSDPDGTIVSYAWNWGDGTTGTGVTAVHKYAQKGTYTVTLTVTDDDGATATVTATIQVK